MPLVFTSIRKTSLEAGVAAGEGVGERAWALVTRQIDRIVIKIAATRGPSVSANPISGSYNMRLNALSRYRHAVACTPASACVIIGYDECHPKQTQSFKE